MRRAVYIDFNPDDPGEKWKHTAAGALARLKECEAGMDREHGPGMNLRWVYWNSEWTEAWEWLRKRARHVAARYAAEIENNATK